MAHALKKAEPSATPTGITLAEAGKELRRLPPDRRSGIALLNFLRQRGAEREKAEDADGPAPLIAEMSYEEVTLWVIEQAARGMEFSHSLGIYGLDFNPEHIGLQVSGELVLPSAIRTPATPSAEMARPSADLCALGEMARDFMGGSGTTAETLKNIESFPLRAILGTCLNPKPAEQFGSAAELADACRTGREALQFAPQKRQQNYRTVVRHARVLSRIGPVHTLLAFTFTTLMVAPLFWNGTRLALAGIAWWAWNLFLQRSWRRSLAVTRRIAVEGRLLPDSLIAQARKTLLLLPTAALSITLLGWILPLLLLALVNPSADGERSQRLVIGAVWLFCFGTSWAATLPRQFFYSVYVALFLGRTQLKARLREETKLLAWQTGPQSLALVGLGILLTHPSARTALKILSPVGLELTAALGCILIVSLARNLAFRREVLARLNS